MPFLVPLLPHFADAPELVTKSVDVPSVYVVVPLDFFHAQTTAVPLISGEPLLMFITLPVPVIPEP